MLRTPLSIGKRTRCGCSGANVPISGELSLFAHMRLAVGSRVRADEMRELYTDYTEHDLVLFVTAHSTRMLSGETLAYACSCENNVIGRPVFGHINW